MTEETTERLEKYARLRKDAMKSEQEKTGEELTLSEKSKVPLTMVGALFGFFVMLITASYYLGTSMSEIKVKLDAMTIMLGTVSTKNATMETRVGEHERDDYARWGAIDARLNIIEKTGSEKTRVIEAELNTLRNEFRVHEALAKQEKKQ